MLGLSQTTGYATLALACLRDPGGDPVLIRDVADCTGIGQPYLAKLIQSLAGAGLVETRRGNRGGVLLARPASDITVFEILDAVEGPGALDGCLLGRADCTDDRACPTHFFWKLMRAEVAEHLSALTLAEVADFERSAGVLSDCRITRP